LALTRCIMKLKVFPFYWATIGGIDSSLDDAGTHLLQTKIVQQHMPDALIELDFDFDSSRWQQRDGYYVGEQHGATNECYSTLKTAMDKCDASSDCHAIATQSNVCGGQYRVSHGGPTLHFYSAWKSYNLRAWVVNKSVSIDSDGISVSSAFCGSQDVTSKIAADCKGKEVCSVTVDDSTSPSTSTWVQEMDTMLVSNMVLPMSAIRPLRRQKQNAWKLVIVTLLPLRAMCVVGNIEFLMVGRHSTFTALGSLTISGPGSCQKQLLLPHQVELGSKRMDTTLVSNMVLPMSAIRPLRRQKQNALQLVIVMLLPLRAMCVVGNIEFLMVGRHSTFTALGSLTISGPGI